MKKRILRTFSKNLVKEVRSIKKMKLWGFMTMICVISAGIFMQSCNQYDKAGNVPEKPKNAADVEVADFKNWFKSQDLSSEFVGTQEADWDNAEVKTMLDGKTLHVSIEIYKGKNAKGNDSVIALQIVYLQDGFRGDVQVLSFYDDVNACAKYYNLTGEIMEEGIYYAPKQLYTSIRRCAIEGLKVEKIKPRH